MRTRESHTHTTPRVELHKKTRAAVSSNTEPGLLQAIEKWLLGIADGLVSLDSIRQGSSDGE